MVTYGVKDERHLVNGVVPNNWGIPGAGKSSASNWGISPNYLGGGGFGVFAHLPRISTRPQNEPPKVEIAKKEGHLFFGSKNVNFKVHTVTPLIRDALLIETNGLAKFWSIKKHLHAKGRESRLVCRKEFVIATRLNLSQMRQEFQLFHKYFTPACTSRCAFAFLIQNLTPN